MVRAPLFGARTFIYNIPLSKDSYTIVPHTVFFIDCFNLTSLIDCIRFKSADRVEFMSNHKRNELHIYSV